MRVRYRLHTILTTVAITYEVGERFVVYTKGAAIQCRVKGVSGDSIILLASTQVISPGIHMEGDPAGARLHRQMSEINEPKSRLAELGRTYNPQLDVVHNCSVFGA